MSLTRSSGSSMAAKCPPRGISVHCRMLKLSSAQALGSLVSSWGNTAQAVGAST